MKREIVTKQRLAAAFFDDDKGGGIRAKEGGKGQVEGMFREGRVRKVFVNMIPNEAGIITAGSVALHEGNVIKEFEFINEFLKMGCDVSGIPFFFLPVLTALLRVRRGEAGLSFHLLWLGRDR